MTEAIRDCHQINGRIPRINNENDFDKIGEMNFKADMAIHGGSWISYIDGTLNGDIEHDGNGKWYDYYDKDIIEYLPWQSHPTEQPNELGVSCVGLHYYGKGDKRNGLGDYPCRMVEGDPIAFCYYKVM